MDAWANKPPLTEKRFVTEKKAEQWARAFDYSRSLLGLALLVVERDGDEWVVRAIIDT